MMLSGAHFLLTYACTYECDHCFVYSSPRAPGVFTLSQIKKCLKELLKIGTVNWVYFEGGEAFLYYPLMLEAIRLSRKNGFEVGIVTNCYWATSEKDALLWLRPLQEMGIADLSLSDDAFHRGDKDKYPAHYAFNAARKMGMAVKTISIDPPKVELKQGGRKHRGEPIIGGGTVFRGRAADKLLEGLPTRPWREFTQCTGEELVNPKRVHLDPYGYVHLCQGLSIGNMWQTPLAELIKNYKARKHPVCRYLVEGGPAMLAEKYQVVREDRYVDACHFCYRLRTSLLDKFPEYLGPRQVYGL